VFLEILLILVLIVLNALLAMSELAILSARKPRLQQMAEGGHAGARAALDLAANPNRLLSTVQIGITLVGILAGAFAGATLAQHLARALEVDPWLTRHSEAIALTIVVVLTTYLTLVIGELVPKRLALGRPERIAVLAARPMRALSVAAAPAVRLLGFSTDLVLRLLHMRAPAEPSVTEDEVRVMVREGVRVGVFETAEQEMVENVFRMGDLRVHALMTVRPDIAWLDLDDPPERIHATIVEEGYSRYPVARGNLDQVVGFVRSKDLLARHLTGQPLDLQAVLRTPLFVPESVRALRVLELFKQQRTHMAIVLDEYGVTQGLVTHDDLLDAIVGDIAPLETAAELSAVRREDGSWLLDGTLTIEDAFLYLQVPPPPPSSDYQTLGGFVMTHLGAVPAPADHFEWGGVRFEVVDMDGRRVDKVLAVPPERSREPVRSAPPGGGRG
jgi:putative hemolysin